MVRWRDAHASFPRDIMHHSLHLSKLADRGRGRCSDGRAAQTDARGGIGKWNGSTRGERHT